MQALQGTAPQNKNFIGCHPALHRHAPSKSGTGTWLSSVFPTQINVVHHSNGERSYSMNSNAGRLRLNIISTVMSIAMMAIGFFTLIPEILAVGVLCTLIAVPLTLYGLWEQNRSTILPINVLTKSMF